jgi:hypothetical protein
VGKSITVIWLQIKGIFCERISVHFVRNLSLVPRILIKNYDDTNLDPQDVNQFLKTWTSDAEIMKQQPGFISTQLHRGIAGSSTFINYAVWEYISQFRQALSNPKFQAKMSDYPASAIASPHLFKKIAVPGVCVE